MHTIICKFHKNDQYTHKCMHANTKNLSFIAELVSCFASISEGLEASKLHRKSDVCIQTSRGDGTGRRSQASGRPEVSDRFVGFRWFVGKMEWVPWPDEPPGQK